MLCKCAAPTRNPFLNSLLNGTLTPPAYSFAFDKVTDKARDKVASLTHSNCLLPTAYCYCRRPVGTAAPRSLPFRRQQAAAGALLAFLLHNSIAGAEQIVFLRQATHAAAVIAQAPVGG